jgi:hypothetical protein
MVSKYLTFFLQDFHARANARPLQRVRFSLLCQGDLAPPEPQTEGTPSGSQRRGDKGNAGEPKTGDQSSEVRGRRSSAAQHLEKREQPQPRHEADREKANETESERAAVSGGTKQD